jgi:hypothetical protein
MAVIDSVVLNVTERACRAFQRLTGKTNVWLAAQLTNLSIVVYFVWVALYVFTIDPIVRAVAALFCAAVLYALTQTVFKVPIEIYERAAYGRVANGLRNPRRIRDALLRTSFLTLCIILLYPVIFVYINLRSDLVLLGYSLIVLTTVVLYVLACDPLPPCPGRITVWLRGLVPSSLATSESNPR